jgi:hypothetical protein
MGPAFEKITGQSSDGRFSTLFGQWSGVNYGGIVVSLLPLDASGKSPA